MTPGRVGAATGAAPPSQGTDEKRLRRAAAEMEGVFFGEMMKALRETVPKDGVIDGGSAESVFTEMLDAHMATVAAVRQGRGLGEALFRQLSRLLPTEAPAAPGEGET